MGLADAYVRNLGLPRLEEHDSIESHAAPSVEDTHFGEWGRWIPLSTRRLKWLRRMKRPC